MRLNSGPIQIVIPLELRPISLQELVFENEYGALNGLKVSLPKCHMACATIPISTNRQNDYLGLSQSHFSFFLNKVLKTRFRLCSIVILNLDFALVFAE